MKIQKSLLQVADKEQGAGVWKFYIKVCLLDGAAECNSMPHFSDSYMYKKKKKDEDNL